jgi:predicted transcriptional regulator
MAMTLRLTPEQDSKLEQIAADLGISKQQAIVETIESYDLRAKRRRLMDEAFELVMTRDAELMRRLADA